MRRGTREDALWTHRRSLVVLFYALIPVLWIVSLSLKTPAIGRRRQLHSRPLDARQLQGRSSTADSATARSSTR